VVELEELREALVFVEAPVELFELFDAWESRWPIIFSAC